MINYKKQELKYEQIALLLSVTALIIGYLRYQAKIKQTK
jgi:hypothetical protein